MKYWWVAGGCITLCCSTTKGNRRLHSGLWSSPARNRLAELAEGKESVAWPADDRLSSALRWRQARSLYRFSSSMSSTPIHNLPPRSHYSLSKHEIVRGIANRFVFSQAYIYLYLSMAILSLTTVILSLLSDCPSLPFYILELIVNSTMILEVSIRLTAFGKQFWKSPFNWIDLAITIFCLVTVLIIFFQGCKAKGEEVFDTILLVIRNVIQFIRLALMLRRSGKNIFSSIPPIDLEAAALQDSFLFDLDMDDDEILNHEDSRPNITSARRPTNKQSARNTDRQQVMQPFLEGSDEE